MSYASKQSGIKISNEVGSDIYTELGSTFPADTETPLVSGTEYIVGGQPVTSGIWGVQVAFDLIGDDTTAFTSVLIRVSTENVGGISSDYNILINTTFPDNGVYSFTYNSFVDIGSGIADPSPIYATILPTFVGTAPTSPSHYLRLFKLV
jgi:hypothetical protein